MSRTPRSTRPSSRPWHRLAAAAAGAVLVAAGASGCTVGDAGSAAVVDGQRLSQAAVADQVAEIRSTLGQDTAGGDAQVLQQVVNQWIIDRLVALLAGRHGVAVTPAAVDKAVTQATASNGGEEAFAQLAASSGVAPSQVPAVIRTNLLAEATAAKLAPGGASDAQTAAFNKALVELEAGTDVEVNPRFGTWDGENFQLGPRPTDLAVPVPTPGAPSATAGPTDEPTAGSTSTSTATPSP